MKAARRPRDGGFNQAQSLRFLDGSRGTCPEQRDELHRNDEIRARVAVHRVKDSHVLAARWKDRQFTGYVDDSPRPLTTFTQSVEANYLSRSETAKRVSTVNDSVPAMTGTFQAPVSPQGDAWSPRWR